MKNARKLLRKFYYRSDLIYGTIDWNWINWEVNLGREVDIRLEKKGTLNEQFIMKKKLKNENQNKNKKLQDNGQKDGEKKKLNIVEHSI